MTTEGRALDTNTAALRSYFPLKGLLERSRYRFSHANMKCRILDEKGPACHSCERPTQVREHIAISAKQLRQPFFYSRWYKCINNQCRTTLIMPNEFKVMNNNAKAAYYKDQEVEREQMDFLRQL